jgi:hypothetical protein
MQMTTPPHDTFDTALSVYFQALENAGQVVQPYRQGLRSAGHCFVPEQTLRLIDDATVPKEVGRLFALEQAVRKGLEGEENTISMLPGLSWLMTWPSHKRDLAFNECCGVPFRWYQQIPVIQFEHKFYTVVCDQQRWGEVWRVPFGPDDYNLYRVSSNLEQLFLDWAVLIDEGYFSFSNDIFVSDMDMTEEQFEQLLQSWPQLNALAISADFDYAADDFLQARQRECGVDVEKNRDENARGVFFDEVEAWLQ